MYIYIRSMSEAQNKIYDRIASRSREINKHIIKLLLFPDCQYVDHWQHEIYAFVNDVPKLKHSNKFPKVKFLKDCLSVNNDCIDTAIWQVEDEEFNLMPISIDADILVKAICDYQDWLASELSTKGAVAQRQVKAKLNELMCKYSPAGGG